jgi:hypothetical protein
MTVSGGHPVAPARQRTGETPVSPETPCPGNSRRTCQAVVGSSRTTTAFETGVLLPSATLSSGTSTFASG